ncbi:MAG: hydroxymethylbilane synthase [Spirochaetota bacterium]|nr:hydroxymethylbilane synthase [Spirochaetota bacterium]
MKLFFFFNILINMLTIGTRGSDLALWQANYIADFIGREKTKITIIKTKGDKIQNISFEKMEGKGFFTKEIEEALLDKRIDIAVHSMKDLPTEDIRGLKIAAVTKREDPSDVLLIRTECLNKKNFLPLFEWAIVGTSSLRRVAQLKNVMNSLDIRPIRGNLPTRIKRLREKKFDSIVVARAGLNRLGIDLHEIDDITLPYSFFLPAPAQGALALQIREEEVEHFNIVNKLNHRETELAVTAERAFLKSFGGGCHIPLGALAYIEKEDVHITGVIASVDGKHSIRKTVVGNNPEDVGRELAMLFKKEGADNLI